MNRVPGYRPLYVEPSGALWAGRGLRLFHSADRAATFAPVAGYRGDVFQRISRLSRLTARLTRAGFHSLVPLGNGAVLATIRKHLLKRDPGGSTLREVFVFPRGSRPMNLCRVPAGAVYFGEYFSNPDRNEVHIYGSDDGGESWHVAHTFAAGRIRHVHGIFYDAHRDGCWVLTGDRDDESMILFTDDGFDHLEPVFAGSQQTRAVALLPTAEALLTGTDTPLEQNYLQRLEPEAGRIDRLQPVAGSVFGGCVAGEHYVFATAVEPSRVNACRQAELWISRDGEQWRRLYTRERDGWQLEYGKWPRFLAGRSYFQHATFGMPAGPNPDPVLYAYGQALKDDDDRLLVWDLPAEWPPCQCATPHGTI